MGDWIGRNWNAIMATIGAAALGYGLGLKEGREQCPARVAERQSFFAKLERETEREVARMQTCGDGYDALDRMHSEGTLYEWFEDRESRPVGGFVDPR